MAKKGEIKDRIGEKFTTNEGYEVEIIEYFKWDNCTAKFNDRRGTILSKLIYSNLQNGTVKNPYHPSVCGKGFLGVGAYSKKCEAGDAKVYIVWRSMLERCYLSKRITYKEVEICEEWYNFQNFAQWFYENYTEGFHLDKDILIKGNKIYSPETCCFVPVELNSLMTKRQNHRGKLPIGVYKQNSKFTAHASKNGKYLSLGTFNTPEEAFEVYKTAKEKRIKELADKWRGQITEKVYQALINYEVEITD